MSKKQNFILLSTAETEYIAIGSCCTQLLWMQKLLIVYGILRILFNILEQNIQRFDTTSFECLSKIVLLLLSSFILMIKRLICSPNLLIANGLNSFAKTLVLSLWIDLLFSSSFLMHLHLVLCFALFNMFLFVQFQFCFILFFIKIKIFF